MKSKLTKAEKIWICEALYNLMAQGFMDGMIDKLRKIDAISVLNESGESKQ